MKMRLPASRGLVVPLLAVLVALPIAIAGQDRLKTMPGYDQFQKMSKEIPTSMKTGALSATWRDGKMLEFTKDGRLYRYDVATRSTTDAGSAPEGNTGGGRRGGRGGDPSRASGSSRAASRDEGAPERGRQFASATSPDGAVKAFYKNRNLWLSAADGSNEKALTTDGSETARIKYGTASWVYGEELGQTTAMWWSPDSRKIAYYRFDEKQVTDYHLQLDQTHIQSRDDAEAYPKPGSPNPIVDLFVYDVTTGKTTTVDVRGGKPFDNTTVGHYVYRVAWSSDGRELLFNRTNRRQNVLELTAANPDTGTCRVIVREEWPTGWITNSPAMRFLKDGKRFIWESERTGWRNLYLYDLSGTLITPLTTHSTFEAGAIVKLDEEAGVVFYTARDGDNFLKPQLHRVGLNGKGDTRLTDPAFHHTVGTCGGTGGGRGAGGPAGAPAPCGISPDSKYFVDVYQTHDTPPATRVVDATTGKVVAELAKAISPGSISWV